MLLDQFYMNLIPYSRYARTVLDCVTLFTVDFWTSLIPPFDMQVPSRGI